MLLITGSSGFVGRHLLKKRNAHSPASFRESGGILPLFYKDAIECGVSINLSDVSAVDALFKEREISAVVHLAAEARVAECENHPEKAYINNVTATSNLLAACQQSLPYFLYVSTDMVFKGDSAPYCEQDHPDAISVYGQTKSLSENLIQSYDGAWCIVRPALIYGSATGGRNSSLSWTLDTIKSGNGCFFTDEIRTPVWIDDLVVLLMALCNIRHQGIVHAGGPERLSRLDFAYLVADVWQLPKQRIRASALGNDPANIKRPRDLSLVSDTANSFHSFTDIVSSLHAVRNSGQI